MSRRFSNTFAQSLPTSTRKERKNCGQDGGNAGDADGGQGTKHEHSAVAEGKEGEKERESKDGKKQAGNNASNVVGGPGTKESKNEGEQNVGVKST